MVDRIGWAWRVDKAAPTGGRRRDGYGSLQPDELEKAVCLDHSRTTLVPHDLS